MKRWLLVRGAIGFVSLGATIVFVALGYEFDLPTLAFAVIVFALADAISGAAE